MAISINKVSEDIKNNVIKDYINGKSIRSISENYNLVRSSVSKFLENNNLKKDKGNHYRLYNHNENFFEIIDTEEKAYWLGFMFADGYIINNENRYGQDQFGIALAQSDISHLEKFKNSINSNNPINIYKRKNNIGQPLARIVLTSQKTVNDLENKGCIKQKSLVLLPPKNVPTSLIRHFIRGYFDGDGSISKSKKEKYKKTSGYIYNINITSTYELISWIQLQTNMGSIIKEKRRDKTYYYSLGGHYQIIKFYHYLYDNCTIYMDRKYNIFQELLTKYSES